MLRKRVTVTRASSCSSYAVQLAARRDMHFFESFSLAIQHGVRSTSSQETALTPAYSKSMGPPAPVRRPQPGRPRSLCRLLHPLPHPQPQAAEVCYSVRYSILCFLDLERHCSFPPTHDSALPRFPSEPSLACHLPYSSHVAAARRWCARSRIHGIIDIVALLGRARHATIRRRTLRARLTTSSRLVLRARPPGRCGCSSSRAINQTFSPLALSRFEMPELPSLSHCPVLPIMDMT